MDQASGRYLDPCKPRNLAHVMLSNAKHPVFLQWTKPRFVACGSE
jgi:hypothetical protein